MDNSNFFLCFYFTDNLSNIRDISKLADAPPALGEPEGHFSVQSGERCYVYRGEEGHFHELRFDGKWRHTDLSKTAGVLSAGQ